MKAERSLNDVFRFVCLRPPALPADPVLLKATPAAIVFGQERSPAKRRGLANDFLGKSSDAVRSAFELQHGGVIDAALAGLPDPGATAGDLAARFGDVAAFVKNAAFQQDAARLSDTLLHAAFADEGMPALLPRLARLYHGYVLLEKLAHDPAAAELPLQVFLRRPLLLPFANDWFAPAGARAVVRAVGVADLLVVKRQIKRYEATEIAYVENIMAGETRARDHRFLTRTEDTLTVENETTAERSEELQATERFELNRETSRTIQEEQKFGFTLSVSASFGPTMEVETGLNVGLERSSEFAESESSSYAQEIVSRSLERIEERVRTERISRVLRETEETNRHGFVNESGAHSAGVYQFLDKIYEAQVFNYGKRQMFDLMVPEPAAWLWHLERQPDFADQVRLPDPPPPLLLTPFELRHGDGDAGHDAYYAKVAARYGATGVTLPPARVRRLTFTIRQPSALDTIGSEADQPRTLHILDIPLPEGYTASRARLSATALSDTGHVRMWATLADSTADLSGPTADIGHGRILRTEGEIELAGTQPVGPAVLKLALVTWETANYVLTVVVTCDVTQEHVRRWQLATHDLIRGAYLNRLLEYNDQVSRIQAEARAAQAGQARMAGAPPGRRQQIMLTELKKHALAIFTNQQLYERDFSCRVEGAPGEAPRFDLAKARETGHLIRFLEHAFEWNHLQYALYPYFWNGQADWASRFRKEDPDYEFEQFLQAGAARVVVPVRPGFEAAVGHYLETGKLWQGDGEPPAVGSDLYVAIADELRERAGAGADPVRVGEPWDVRIPTSLVLLRTAATLPAWQEAPAGSWEWLPAGA